jgi:hypothetical protein
LLAGVELAELAGALAAADFSVERFGISFSAEDLGAVAALLVAPADAPHDPGLSL